MVTTLSAHTFETAVLKNKKPVIVDFWAAWCAPCKMLAPIYEELEPQFKGKASFAKINIDENEYREAMLVFYEINSIVPFKKIFIGQYDFAAKNYAVK